jgi:hypothetical protein
MYRYVMKLKRKRLRIGYICRNHSMVYMAGVNSNKVSFGKRNFPWNLTWDLNKSRKKQETQRRYCIFSMFLAFLINVILFLKNVTRFYRERLLLLFFQSLAFKQGFRSQSYTRLLTLSRSTISVLIRIVLGGVLLSLILSINTSTARQPSSSTGCLTVVIFKGR